MIKTDLGYFDTENNEFVITEMHPRRVLKNYLWNEKVVGTYDQFGTGIATGKTDKIFRELTYDVRLVYVKDHETKEFYSPNRNYLDENFDKYETHVGLGYQRIISEYHGLRFEFTILIPRADYAEVYHIKVKNIGNTVRDTSVYFCNRPKINLSWHDAFSRAVFDKENNGILFTHIGYAVYEKNNIVFTGCNEKPVSFDVAFQNFKGLYNEPSRPAGVLNNHLSNKEIDFEGDFCSAFEFAVKLNPGEEKDINLVTCFAKSIEEAYFINRKYISNMDYAKELAYQKELHNDLDSKLMIHTGHDYIDNLENVWLKRQISLGKTWGRVYGKGFRDIMQDVSSFLSLDNKFAREVILNTLAYQRENGNTIRQFEPVYDYPYQDGATWIASTVLAYLKETNDFSILDEKVGYLESDLVETVFEHMNRGYNYLLTDIGEYGLVKWRGGDWNDSIEGAGLKGIGESVWVSIATVRGINDFIEIIKKSKKPFDLESLENKKALLEKAILEKGYDKDHFIYGIDDQRRIIGGYNSVGPKTFLNPQTWAVLANIGSKEIQEKAMDVVEKNLQCDWGYLQSDVPFTIPDDGIGRITYFAKGTFENGSVYNHGVAFKIYADLLLGRPDNAFKSLNLILPINPLNKNNGMEPYAIGNMYFGAINEFRPGYAPGSWITGTAGWIYRAISEMMLGIKPDYDGLIIDPCLPNDIQETEIKRIYQGKTYNISIKRTGSYSLMVDGVLQIGKKIKSNSSSVNVVCTC